MREDTNQDEWETKDGVAERVSAGLRGKCTTCGQPGTIVICWCRTELCSACLKAHFRQCDAAPTVFSFSALIGGPG